MKKTVITLFFACITSLVTGQIKDPVSWSYETKKKTADTYDVIITAHVEEPWHIYSQKTGKGGPIPTRVSFKANPLLVITGSPKELGKVEQIYDDIFKTNVAYLSGKVQYVQTVKLKSSVKTNISGTVEYMVCDDTQCLPPAKKSFDLKLQ